MSKKPGRYIIDKIDARLGDVEKEKKFDLACIFISVLIIALSAVLMSIDKVKLMIVGLFLAIIGVSFLYTMIKEYIADCRKGRSITKG